MRRIGLFAAFALLCGFSQTSGGYECRDSDEPNGPLYQWDDISTTGTPVSFYIGGPLNPDDNGWSFPSPTIPFPFTYFGTSYTSVTVCVNGMLGFGGASTLATNLPLADAGTPPNLIAPFWDDLHLGSGTVLTSTLGAAPSRRFVISFIGVSRPNATTTYGPHTFTFQVALYEQGNGIRIQYQSMNDNGGTPAAAGQGATVGIRNVDGTAVNQYLFDGAPAGNAIGGGLAIGFVPAGTPAPWPTGGTPPPPPPPPGGGGGGNGGSGDRTSRLCGGGASAHVSLVAIAAALLLLAALRRERSASSTGR